MQLKVLISVLVFGCTQAVQQDFALNETANATLSKKSRKKMDMAFQPRIRLGPNANEPTPTVLFHGVK